MSKYETKGVPIMRHETCGNIDCERNSETFIDNTYIIDNILNIHKLEYRQHRNVILGNSLSFHLRELFSKK
jgi:hypothetical protein